MERRGFLGALLSLPFFPFAKKILPSLPKLEQKTHSIETGYFVTAPITGYGWVVTRGYYPAGTAGCTGITIFNLENPTFSSDSDDSFWGDGVIE